MDTVNMNLGLGRITGYLAYKQSSNINISLSEVHYNISKTEAPSTRTLGNELRDLHNNNNTVKTHHGGHTHTHTHSKKEIPKSNNMYAALQTIPLQNNTQYCRKKVQGHGQNNPNFSSRNKISPLPPTIFNPKQTASWEAAER
jgi:hypothetical protein